MHPAIAWIAYAIRVGECGWVIREWSDNQHSPRGGAIMHAFGQTLVDNDNVLLALSTARPQTPEPTGVIHLPMHV